MREREWIDVWKLKYWFPRKIKFVVQILNLGIVNKFNSAMSALQIILTIQNFVAFLHSNWHISIVKVTFNWWNILEFGKINLFSNFLLI